jgi:hypothetical protein
MTDHLKHKNSAMLTVWDDRNRRKNWSKIL